jgi:hypothetical protein
MSWLLVVLVNRQRCRGTGKASSWQLSAAGKIDISRFNARVAVVAPKLVFIVDVGGHDTPTVIKSIAYCVYYATPFVLGAALPAQTSAVRGAIMAGVGAFGIYDASGGCGVFRSGPE